MKKINLFLKIVVFTFSIPALLGIVVGLLYSFGYLGDAGWWIQILDWVANALLDKFGFIFEIAALSYIVLWAFLGKLAKVYSWGKWLLIKCFLGVAVVPVFVFVVSFWIPAFVSLRPDAFFIAIMGLVLSWAWYEFLP